MKDYKFAKFININGKFKAFNNQEELIKLYADGLNDLQFKIDNVLEYMENIKNSDTEIIENSKGEHIDVGYAVPALEDIEDILKGDE